MLYPGVGPNLATDEEHFFQSDLSIEQQQARKIKQTLTQNKGNPLQLPSKVLAFELVEPSIADGAIDCQAVSKDTFFGGTKTTILPESTRVLAYVGESGHVARKVDLQSGSTLKVFKGHTGPVTSLAILYNAQGKDWALFTGSWDKTIRKWNTDDTTQILCIQFHNDFVKSVCLYGDVLYSASTDKTICKWNATTGAHMKTLRGHTRGVEAILLTADGKTLFSASSDTTIRKWDTETCKEVAILKGHDTSVYGLALSEDETELWSASADKTARCWDLEKNLPTAILEHPDFVRSVMVMGDLGLVATGSRDEHIRFWNTATDKCVRTIEAHTGEVSALKMTSSNVVLSGSLDNTVRFWLLADELAMLDGIDATRAQSVNAAPENRATDLPISIAEESTNDETATSNPPIMSEEEERELAELMADLS
ncbi:hypothetical protein BASA50_003002 [Batrachochytrium salamandrivorans]|uniref:Anaphase-promoting complex subunit 4 WD40 domain-containing protein n=1 Tax=Batrachochytrium salamandrivorans TaxID=1357716 RepID=A0ABQ8FK68_9FUNG|nr:hypothetical protein BASA60_007114 [Batrachochytrium salamandrivorans]KAH6581127.1 hypothetical protein BASA61_009199 [Batrachochytrium salamandrivorans]KAH6599489.1 hypothetical protein BASA50_003002 [Batrachochytrium salamandrivorans]KAH9247444.1 hypothetical protein BASA81_014955 [Batrachochytrium salamandrivorans]KAH9267753.1 hypothetical protein BASA84_000535 [Batrachochytrium salamandrivorans]